MADREVFAFNLHFALDGKTKKKDVIPLLQHIVLNRSVDIASLITFHKITISEANAGFRGTNLLAKVLEYGNIGDFGRVVKALGGPRKVARELFNSGDLETFRTFDIHLEIDSNWFCSRDIESKIKANNIDAIQMLAKIINLDPYFKLQDASNLAAVAATHGHLDLLKWMYKTYDLCGGDWAFNCAAEYGHLHVLQWFPVDKNRSTAYALKWSIAGGHVEVAEWLIDTFNLTKRDVTADHNDAFWMAAERGHLKMLQFLTKKCELTLLDVAQSCKNRLGRVVINGKIYVLQWLIEEFQLDVKSIRTDKNYIFAHAAEGGDLELLQWAIVLFGADRKYILESCGRLFRIIAQGGHLAILQWVIAEFGITTEELKTYVEDMVSWAAGRGHLKILLWLDKKVTLTNEIATANQNHALYWAAENGHIKVVKWLVTTFEITREDVIRYKNATFRWIAEGGHLDVLKWLTEHLGLTEADLTWDDRFIYKYAKSACHHDICNWMIEKFDLNYDLEDSPQPESPSDVGQLLLDAVEDSPESHKISFVIDALKIGIRITDSDLRGFIDSCKESKFYYEANSGILNRIIKIYDFYYKSRDEVMQIVKRICKKCLVPQVDEYLINRGIISEPRITVKQVRKAYPEYIFTKPKDLVKYIAENAQ